MNALVDSIKLIARLAALYFLSFVASCFVLLWVAVWLVYWRKK